MSHRNVVMRDQYGDEVRGTLHPPAMSDEPPTVAVNGTRLFLPVWMERGWHIIHTAEYDE